MVPVRYLDSSTGKGLSGAFATGTPRGLTMGGLGQIPADAAGISGNLTLVGPTSAVLAQGAPTISGIPTSSTVNASAHQTVANGFDVPLHGSDSVALVWVVSTARPPISGSRSPATGSRAPGRQVGSMVRQIIEGPGTSPEPPRGPLARSPARAGLDLWTDAIGLLTWVGSSATRSGTCGRRSGRTRRIYFPRNESGGPPGPLAADRTKRSAGPRDSGEEEGPMKSLVAGLPSTGSRGPSSSRGSRRVIARLLALGAAAALAVALMPATAIAAPAQPATVAASGDWTQFHNGPTHQGYNTAEHVLSPSNVGALGAAWTATTGYSIDSSPAVANGVVYVGSEDYKLYAYGVGCASGGGTCTPLWTALTGDAIYSSPAVADGVVYVGSADGKLYAYAVGCASGGGTCSPLWTATTGSYVISSPAVANGVVYVGSFDGKLYAYAVGCNSGGGTCSPLWTAATGGNIYSSPAVANGVVYVGSWDHKLYAFAVGCASGGGTCSPLWTAATGGAIWSSPAVANGVVYVGSADDKLYAFDSAGVVGCSGSPKTCTPLWTAATGSTIDSSPAVANGVVYVGSADDKLYAYGVGCASGGGSCTPLWTGATGSGIYSSPAVANGVVYVGSEDHKLYAFAIIGATYFTVAPARVLDSRPGGGHIGPPTFHSRTKQTFAVATVASGVPTDAIAVTGNVTVVGQSRSGYVVVAPSLTSGVQPPTSTINFPVNDTRANGITVALGAGGTLDAMYWSSSTADKVDILFDVTGYFRN